MPNFTYTYIVEITHINVARRKNKNHAFQIYELTISLTKFKLVERNISWQVDGKETHFFQSIYPSMINPHSTPFPHWQ